MLGIDESAAGCLDAQGVYFDGSLELLRELAVTSDLDAALQPLPTGSRPGNKSGKTSMTGLTRNFIRSAFSISARRLHKGWR